jgi:hypothetical protein
MRGIAIFMVAAFTLNGCGVSPSTGPGANFALPQLVLTGQAPGPYLFTDASPLALYLSAPVVPLFGDAEIPTNEGDLNPEFWGTKDSAGNILQVVEAGISGLPENGALHIFFDSSNRPILFRDDASGASMAVVYQSATQQRVTLCDFSGVAVASTQVALVNNVAQVIAVSSGGSCKVAQSAAIFVRPAAQSSIAFGTATSALSVQQLIDQLLAIEAVTRIALGVLSAAALGGADNFGIRFFMAFGSLLVVLLPAIREGLQRPGFVGISASAPESSLLPPFIPENSLPGCFPPPLQSCPFPAPEPTQ